MVVPVVRVGRSEVDIRSAGAHEATLSRRNPAGQLAGGVNVSRSLIPSAASIAATRSII